jgi:predicted Zn-dependent protease
VVNVFLPVFLLFTLQASAEKKLTPEEAAKSVQAVVADLESHLRMSQHIDISIVPAEARMLSVQRIRHVSGGDVFLINVDRGFLDSLKEEELRAALAHELGHVWIFSHHPYLQTEALANEIAMRVVSRDDLKTLYEKLWLHLGSSGDLEELLGSPRASPSTATLVH